MKVAIKMIVAASILGWLIKNDRLDFKLLIELSSTPHLVGLGFLFLCVNIVVANFRWKVLLESKSDKKIKITEIIPIGWIGQLFSSILPGAVTGDLIKIFYVRKFDPKFNKTFLISSILLDRVLGLTGLLFVSGIFSLYSYTELVGKSPEIKSVIMFNFLALFGSLCFLSSLFLSKKIQNIIHDLFAKIPLIGEKVNHLFEQLWSFGEDKKRIFIGLFLSIFVQTSTILAFWFLTRPFITIDFPLNYAYSIIPLGIIVTAIPISPGGLGVGHAFFDMIFNMVGISNGASLFNIFFVIMFITNLFGIIPYVLYNKDYKPSAKELEELS